MPSLIKKEGGEMDDKKEVKPMDYPKVEASPIKAWSPFKPFICTCPRCVSERKREKNG